MKKKVLKALIAGMVMVSLLSGCGAASTSTSSSARGDRDGSNGGLFAGFMDKTDSSDTAPAYDSGNWNTITGVTADMCEGTATYDTSASYCTAECDYDDSFVWYDDSYGYDEFNTEEYSAILENGFSQVAMSPLSTFSADVDTASYANLRRMINQGYSAASIPSGAIRTEEMLNYFSYNYDGPNKNEPFGVNAMISDCPWNKDAKLLMLGLQTEEIDFSEAGDSNIVFLIDVSGSMYDDNKLPLLKQAFGLLVENLGEKDRVSIVTYASSNEIVLCGEPGCNQAKIMDALNGLEAGGSTNGGEGIISAYEIAEKYFIEGGNNRVILATDGDLNVGLTSQSELYDLITEEKESGVFLSVLGFGMGNYSDTNMETLADYGNGNYAYIDSLSEARKVLVEELGATMVTVAKDVKLQVEFNPLYVSEYRLIGYENRSLAAEDFADDTKDAGEIGAGHSVTVLYELVLNEDGNESESELKYQENNLTNQALESGEWLTLSVRYKEPDEDESKLLEYPIGEANYTEKPSKDFMFAADVAAFSMLLRDSEYKGTCSYQKVLSSLGKMDDLDEYQEEFVELVEAMALREG